MSWRPSATLETLTLRAGMLARIREFFAERGVLEVETPMLSAAATPDPALYSFSTRFIGPGAPAGKTVYLHTSPEYPMKRLLAAGSGDIYQLCKVFRDGECGRLHNPEFTLLEWYRVGFDHHALMDEVGELAQQLLGEPFTRAPIEKLSYQEAFERYADINPHTAPVSALADCARAHAIVINDIALQSIDGWRDLLLTHVIEPRLGRGRITFVYDYPASQAALARIRPGDPPLAERFELYVEGLELANGFHELADAEEQRTRLTRDLAIRTERNLPPVPTDNAFLGALEHGLPPCAGVALGFDRLVMLAAGAKALAQVLSFPFGDA